MNERANERARAFQFPQNQELTTSAAVCSFSYRKEQTDFNRESESQVLRRIGHLPSARTNVRTRTNERTEGGRN